MDQDVKKSRFPKKGVKGSEPDASVRGSASTLDSELENAPFESVAIPASHVSIPDRRAAKPLEDGVMDSDLYPLPNVGTGLVRDSKLVKGFVAQLAPSYLKLDFFALFWIFVVASILGLIIEDVFHLIVYRGWESRAGLVWGPFSPIYGVGAVCLTLFLNRFYYTHNLIIFLGAMVIGSALEFGTSWMMEYFWHAIAWDYTGTFGSIDGRTNFVFGVMWGALGLFWVRSVLPVIKRIQRLFTQNRTRLYKMLTSAMVVFMLVNALTTVLALNRAGERTSNLPPRTQIDVVLDQAFPDEWIQQRFHNMTVSAEVGAD